jgi:hypothetical protein
VPRLLRIACVAAAILLLAFAASRLRTPHDAPKASVKSTTNMLAPTPQAKPVPPPAPASEATLELEVALLRERVSGIQRGDASAPVQRLWIEQYFASRSGAFAALFSRDPAAPEHFLTLVLAEKDAVVRLAFARLLRTAPGLRDRLLGLADRDVAIAALGSPSDASVHDLLAAAAHSGSTEETRTLAIESIAFDATRYDAWQGRSFAEEVLRRSLASDASARVRMAAAEALLRFVPESPERTALVRDLIARETDSGVQDILKQGLGETKE